MNQEEGYAYYSAASRVRATVDVLEKRQDAARALGDERFSPPLTNPDFLLLNRRRELLRSFIASIASQEICVLDVGGRIQPYRRLFGDRLTQYIAVDPQLAGVADVVGVGEALPFASESFDVVLCTQVLTYAEDPFELVDEMHRVLKVQGSLMLSVPAFFPRHHDELWRFLPDGIRKLMFKFDSVEIIAEGGSLTGILRTLNTSISNLESDALRSLLTRCVIPLVNLAGVVDRNSRKDGGRMTANYCALGRKAGP